MNNTLFENTHLPQVTRVKVVLNKTFRACVHARIDQKFRGCKFILNKCVRARQVHPWGCRIQRSLVEMFGRQEHQFPVQLRASLAQSPVVTHLCFSSLPSWPPAFSRLFRAGPGNGCGNTRVVFCCCSFHMTSRTAQKLCLEILLPLVSFHELPEHVDNKHFGER